MFVGTQEIEKYEIPNNFIFALIFHNETHENAFRVCALSSNRTLTNFCLKYYMYTHENYFGLNSRKRTISSKTEKLYR